MTTEQFLREFQIQVEEMNSLGPFLRDVGNVNPNLRGKRAKIEPLMDVIDTYERCTQGSQNAKGM
jgi:hypothetical protein